VTVSNLYLTTADFLLWKSPQGNTTNANDDAYIDALCEAVSRFADNYTGRHFFPNIQARLYNIPSFQDFERDTIYLDDDLLAITTLLNGDGTTIAGSEYILKSANITPYWAVKLRDTSSVSWQPSTAGSGEQVLSVAGTWGFHDKYGSAWLQAGTLGAAISDTTSLTATMTAGHTLASQQIWRIDSEILQGTATVNALTFTQRGDNFSTAATHLINAPVYVWHPIPQIRIFTQQVVNSFYQKRNGVNVSSKATITAAGVVLSPEDIPASALAMLKPYMRLS
jgi:hypothetical protein